MVLLSNVPSQGYAKEYGAYSPYTNEDGNDIVVDSLGNSYTTGYYSGQMTLGTINLTAFGNTDVLVLKLDASGNVQWATGFGGTSYDEGSNIALDASTGSVYVTGYFTDTMVVGTTTLRAVESGTFVVKLNSLGSVVWAIGIQGTSYNAGQGIAIDASTGNVYVMGYFLGNATIGNVNLTSVGGSDVFVAKINPSGSVLYALSFGSTSDDEGYDMEVDSPTGNAYLTGYFRDVMSVGGTTLTSLGGDDIFVIKLDPTGSVLWAMRMGGIEDERGSSIALDTSSNAYLTGYFAGNFTAGTTTLTALGSTDGFVMKLDPTGSVLWAIAFGGFDDDQGISIAVDGAANAYVTGFFYSTNMTVDGTLLTGVEFYTMFAIKVNPSGSLVYAMALNASEESIGRGIGVDAGGNAYIAGYFIGVMTVGSTSYVTALGSKDMFVLKLDSSGTDVDVTVYGSVDPTGTNDEGRGIAVDPTTGSACITGHFYGIMTLGSTTLTGIGGKDIFIMQLDPFGEVNWAISLGSTLDDQGTSVALDGGGNAYVTGYYSGSMSVTGTTTMLVPTDDSTDIFVCKLDAASGSVVWALGFGGSDTDGGMEIAVDNTGISYVTGYFKYVMTVGNSITLTAEGFNDIFVVQLDPSGNVGWAKSFANGVGNSIALDMLGSTAWLTGYFTGNLTAGTTTLTASEDRADVVVMKLDSSGSVLWAGSFGGTQNDFGQGIAVDGSGHAYVAGIFSGSMMVGNNVLTALGDDDIFTIKFDPVGNLLWATAMGGNNYDAAFGVAVDIWENVYITGIFTGSMTVDGITLTAVNTDAFVAKLHPSGSVLQLMGFESTGFDTANSIAVDNAGHAYTTGYFMDTLTVNGTTLTTLGGDDIFVVKWISL